MKKILIIEDDKSIIELIDIHLKDIHCKTKKAYTGMDGMNYAQDVNYDMIILDIMLPDIDGIEICKKLRASNVTTPILMLTARSEEIDKIIGLESGADDYLTKPFSIREFIARVKAMLRRAELGLKSNSVASGVITHSDLSVDPQKRKVILKGNTIDLTPKEFDLLYLLISNPGKSYSRVKLLNLVWGYEFSGYEHTVNSHINRLRTKVEADISSPKYIITKWGVGYHFSDELK
jgi:two-component system, OmpR family, alkaline phosphatase synthesis response regulator PhoP